MYSAFVDKVQTLQGKQIINKYKTTFDAQKVFAELSDHALKSTSANLNSSNILTFLTSDRLGLDAWKFTTEDYVLLIWLNKLRIYEEMAPSRATLQDPTSKVMLQNAVSMVPQLNAIKDDELHRLTHGQSPLSFSGYQNLLLSACSTLNQYLARTRRNKPRNMNILQQAQEHYVAPSSIDVKLHDMSLVEHDNDAPLEAHRTHMENCTTYRPTTIRGDTWRQISKEGQTTWDLLSDCDKKHLILDEAYARHSRHVSFHSTHQYKTLEPNNAPPIVIDKNPTTPADHSDMLSTSLKVMAHGVLNKNDPITPPPGNIHRLLGKPSPKKTSEKPSFRTANVTYRIHTRHSTRSSFGSLIDHGANGGNAGDEVRIINKSDRHIDVSGIDSHELTDLPIVSASGVVCSQAGDLILIFHQYALLSHGKTIHASLQLEASGFAFPHNFIHGLPYLAIRPYTDHEWDTLPHVSMTSNTEWDPTIYDVTLSNDSHWYSKKRIPDPIPAGPFDHTGQYSSTFHTPLDMEIAEPTDFQDCISIHSTYTSMTAHEHHVHPKPTAELLHPDASALQQYFLYQDPMLISRTFRATTHFARSPMG
eukprot:Nitzschia sp. Nitz4//scaffold501_size4582//2099//3937//NITZ4_009240-RA/size4582-snap-gene-0.0-mRNA-1//-1//CDS//3329553590//1298//frame0